jgi:hypothetical protein
MARLLLERSQAAMIAGPDRSATVNYTHYDYLELAPGASRARVEAAYAALLERFQYGMTDAGSTPRTRCCPTRIAAVRTTRSSRRRRRAPISS